MLKVKNVYLQFILAIFITVAVIAAEAYPQGSYGKSAPSTGYPETKSAQEEVRERYN